MIQEAIKNLHNSGNTKLSINELRVVVALERAVARLEQEPQLAKSLVFKGGFVLLKCYKATRFTRDVDALIRGMSLEQIKRMVPDALSLDLRDGLWFCDVKIEDITDQGDYGGLRFNIAFQIDEVPKDHKKFHKLSRIHIDIGCGDALSSPKKQIMMSVFQETKPVSWLIYPAEFIFSEKLQTIIERGAANSRAKDVYDLVFIYESCKENLWQAIKETFRARNTALPDSFHGYLTKMDTTILASAWKSIQQNAEQTSFDEMWKRLIEIVRKIDLMTHKS